MLPGDVGLDLVWVPPGEFRMGCSSHDDDCRGNESRGHKKVAGFWMGRYELTQRQWKAVMGSDTRRVERSSPHGEVSLSNPSYFQEDDRPVESVSWFDAQEFLAKAGQALRLPTDVEWEYAARAGTTKLRYGALDAIAWYHDNSGEETRPVGLKQANAWGLYDVIGNVMEWTQDRYKPTFAERLGPFVWTEEDRVHRGGYWNSMAWETRVSQRLAPMGSMRGHSTGFRVARSSR
jgi:formylglycine-generating enzyme required for sulfatase activity